MRECIRTHNYRMTEHAQDEAWKDDIAAEDIENTINYGYIIEKQKDRETGEAKFVIRNILKYQQGVEVVAKIGFTGRLYILTVYLI